MNYILTSKQLAALTDLRDGKWRYGISISGRHSLTSLHKRGLVFKHYNNTMATEWQISPEGLKLLKEYIPELETAS